MFKRALRSFLCVAAGSFAVVAAVCPLRASPAGASVVTINADDATVELAWALALSDVQRLLPEWFALGTDSSQPTIDRAREQLDRLAGRLCVVRSGAVPLAPREHAIAFTASDDLEFRLVYARPATGALTVEFPARGALPPEHRMTFSWAGEAAGAGETSVEVTRERGPVAVDLENHTLSWPRETRAASAGSRSEALPAIALGALALVGGLAWILRRRLRSGRWRAVAVGLVAAGVWGGSPEARAGGGAGGLFFGKVPDPANVRRAFIAAEPVQWDYLPAGRDEVCGAVVPPDVLRDRAVGKLRYVRYTDESFRTPVRETAPSLGILGPVLRGVVGEFLVVTFLNRSGQPLSMHPHGVRYDKDSEGSFYRPDAGKGARVEPGERFTYVWQLDEASGPLASEPSSKAWLYHSHVAGDDEINAGLVGVIIVTDPKRARPDGTPADVDRELATLFLIFDESGLGAEEKEAYEYVDNGSGIPVKSFAEVQETLERGARASINGRLYGNLKGLEMNEGERVRWYLFGLGSQQDFHTAHWHGQRVVAEGRRTDVVELLPATMKVADLVADNPGNWLFHCHVADHMREGMYAPLIVHPRDVVGVDRSPEAAFLGLASGVRSLAITRAETRAGKLTLEGEAAVSEAFTVFRQTVRVEVGGETFEFRPDASGRGTARGATFAITNAGEMGVVYGGVVTFALTLPAPRDDAGGAAGDGRRTLVLALGEARHVATFASGKEAR